MGTTLRFLSRLSEKCAVLQRPTSLPTEVADPVPEQVRTPLSALPCVPINGLLPEETKLVQRLFVLPGQDAPRSVAFCGIDEEQESTRMCTRVADILATRPGNRVCLVHANLRAPVMYNPFASESPLGFSEDSKESASNGFAQQVAGRNLWLVPPASVDSPGQNLLSIDYLRPILPRLKDQFSAVLVAAGAINRDPGTVTLGQLVDGVVLVIKANATRRLAAMKAKELLEASQVRLLGAVLTERTYPIPERLYRNL